MRTLFLILTFAFCAPIEAQTEMKVPPIKQIASGSNLLCALFTTGEIACRGALTGQLRLKKLPTGRTATQIAAGENHVCAILDNAAIACWTNLPLVAGSSLSTERDYYTDSSLPKMTDIGGLKAISIQASYNLTCAMFSDGSGTCWGTSGDDNLSPLPVAEIPKGLKFKQLLPGASHMCGILTDDGIYCWGMNNFRQLGTPPKTDTSRRFVTYKRPVGPIAFGKNQKPLQLALGFGFSCALFATDSIGKTLVKCWGRNETGALGIGSNIGTDDQINMKDIQPVDLPSGFFPNRIVAGRDSACAMNTHGILFCWGRNFGHMSSVVMDNQIGDEPGEMGDMMIPFNWGNFVRARDVVLNQNYTCVLIDSTNVKCWGYSLYSSFSSEVVNLSESPDMNKFAELLHPVDFSPAFIAEVKK